MTRFNLWESVAASDFGEDRKKISYTWTNSYFQYLLLNIRVATHVGIVDGFFNVSILFAVLKKKSGTPIIRMSDYPGRSDFPVEDSKSTLERNYKIFK